MKENEEVGKKAIESGRCPVCGAKLIHKEGCVECPQCGWSVCIEA